MFGFKLEPILPAILYSFRRCPYAMRARYAIATLGISVQLREVVLKNKPEALLSLGGRSTVPQLLVGGMRYPESLDIIHWALKNSPNVLLVEQLWPSDPQKQAKISAWIGFNDHCFKPWLDRYKYADRYPEQSESDYREKGERFLKRINQRLEHHDFLLGNHMTIADIAVFPFIRQFAGVDSYWFEASEYLHLKRWLKAFLEGEYFRVVMKKFSPWEEGQEILNFPEPL